MESIFKAWARLRERQSQQADRELFVRASVLRSVSNRKINWPKFKLIGEENVKQNGDSDKTVATLTRAPGIKNSTRALFAIHGLTRHFSR